MSAPIPLRPAVVAGDWIVISGQLGLKDGKLVEGGAQAQAAQALANLKDVVEQNGGTIADVVKTNVFLVTTDDYVAMNEEYSKVFTSNYPARSAVAVHQLPLGGLVEIEAWVYRPAS